MQYRPPRRQQIELVEPGLHGPARKTELARSFENGHRVDAVSACVANVSNPIDADVFTEMTEDRRETRRPALGGGELAHEADAPSAETEPVQRAVAPEERSVGRRFAGTTLTVRAVHGRKPREGRGRASR